MAVHTHYDTLKVARDAPDEVIAAAYRALAKKYHPDTNPHRSAATTMQSINAARDVLLDPARRGQYDIWVSRQEAMVENYPDIFRRARKVALENGIQEKDLRLKRGAFRILRDKGKDALGVMLIKFEFQQYQKA